MYGTGTCLGLEVGRLEDGLGLEGGGVVQDVQAKVLVVRLHYVLDTVQDAGDALGLQKTAPVRHKPLAENHIKQWQQVRFKKKIEARVGGGSMLTLMMSSSSQPFSDDEATSLA